MKKRKRTYSLTAKERKQKRYGKDNTPAEREQKPVAANSQNARVTAEREMVASQKRSRTSAIVIGGVVCLAILLMIGALIAPIIMYVVNPYRGYSKTVARFNLSNGMELEFLIDEKEYDAAATNFIFLAKNGFFDNTVFFDAQNGWLRFGGFTDQPTNSSLSDYSKTHHKKDSESFCKSFSALPNASFTKWSYKFGYRLKADENGTNRTMLEKEGVLVFRYGDTSTEFQVSYKEQATNEIHSVNQSGTTTLDVTMVGRVLNKKTLDNIKRIAGSAKVNEDITDGYLWMPPTPDIRINSVKVYNLKDSKWKNFDFLRYVKDKDLDREWYGTN